MDGISTENIPITGMVNGTEQDNGQEIEGIMILLEELMDSIRAEAANECLETAISLLQATLENKATSGQDRLIIHRELMRSLLVRYGLFGWIEDLNSCMKHLIQDVGAEKIDEFVLVCQGSNGNAIDVQIAAQLIKAFQCSIDIATLDTMICAATEALAVYKAAYSNEELRSQASKLWIVLGKALVMTYINNGDITVLHQASQGLQQAEVNCLEDTISEYICLTALLQIELLRLIEYGDREALFQLYDYRAKVAAADAEGAALDKVGTDTVEQAVNNARLQEGIAILIASLRCRMSGHPRQWYSLNSLSNAFLTSFKRGGDHGELESSITLRREALDIYRPPHPGRSISLSRLADSLSTRFKHKGSFEDLEECIALQQEALDICWTPHSGRWGSLNSLANSILIRFNHKGASKDLEECISLHREALDLCRSPHPDRYKSLSNLASCLCTRFSHKGAFGIGDLEACIALYEEALDLCQSPHPDRWSLLSHLANSLSFRFEHKGAFEDLEACIAFHREALNLRRSPHPDRFKVINNLASCLSLRFKHKRAFGDLEECIALHRDALDLRRSPHPDRAISLHNLADSLFSRFKHKGAFEDLEECIAFHREALNLRRPPHPGRWESLNGLANSLSFRFKHKGAFGYLEECIALYREALDLRQPPHPDRSKSLNNLAISLSTLFRHKGVFKDLEDCIVLQQEALDLCRPPHPDRLGSLNNLANSLSLRFDHKGALEDLEECIALAREALDLCQPPHPDRFMSLNTLAGNLSTRFKHKKTFEDLEESIALHRDALDLCRPPSPDRCASLHNLARSLFFRFKWKGRMSRSEQKDIQHALDYLREAAQYPTGSLVQRLHISKHWASCAQDHSVPLTLDAYKYSMELLPQLASLDLTLQQRQDVLQLSRNLVSDAAGYSIHVEKYELAATFLSTGRSIFWAQALQLRTPVNDLMITHSDIAARFTTISMQLENASHSRNNSSLDLLSVEEQGKSTEQYTSLHRLLNQHQDTIEKIRKIPGYEGFLLPPSFSALQLGAKDSPVIFLITSKYGCNALIMHGEQQVEHIPLPGFDLNELEVLKLLIHTPLFLELRSAEMSRDIQDSVRKMLRRDFVIETLSDGISRDGALRLALECLWSGVVHPVLNALGIAKTIPLKRIWWCPTGPFVSLPIHAAGIYSETNTAIDCLFQYAVSSYCTSPQDLLYPSPRIAQSFKMTAVIEPEAPNAGNLPATLLELERIKEHVPNQQNLTTHLGSSKAPNQVRNVVSDIQQSSFVHFGCHGKQNFKNPLESLLLLSGGKLTMSTLIKECRVPEGALAYLSACETAKGDEENPDESLNLVATMMFAGFRSVIGTLWSILDDDAPIVADVFYRHLFRKGKDAPPDVRDAAYGLHLATNRLRDLGKPLYSWVPYVHYGI